MKHLIVRTGPYVKIQKDGSVLVCQLVKLKTKVLLVSGDLAKRFQQVMCCSPFLELAVHVTVCVPLTFVVNL